MALLIEVEDALADMDQVLEQLPGMDMQMGSLPSWIMFLMLFVIIPIRSMEKIQRKDRSCFLRF